MSGSREFRANPAMRAEIEAEIIDAYAGTDYPRPTVDEVIDAAFRAVGMDIQELAAGVHRCNKVDTCTAEAVVLDALADWLAPEEARRG